MTVYILNIFLIVLNNLLIKNKKIYIYVCSIQIFLLLALRNNFLGADALYYFNGYTYISHLGFFDMLSRLHLFKSATLVYPFKFECGFVVFNWIIAHLGFDYHFFLVICAFINIYVYSKAILKFSKIPWLSFVILCTFGTYFYFFYILRQSFALCLFMISFMYAHDNKNYKSIFVFIVSFLFHRVSIVFLPVLYLQLTKKQITKKKSIVLIIASVPFILISKYLVKFVQLIVVYFNGGSYVSNGMKFNNMLILIYLISIIVVIFMNFEVNKDDNLFNILIWIMNLSIYLEIMGQYNEVWERSMQLYNSFLIFLIPYVVYQYRGQKMTIFISFFIVCLLTGYMCYYLQKDKYLLPYQIQKINIIFNEYRHYHLLN